MKIINIILILFILIFFAVSFIYKPNIQIHKNVAGDLKDFPEIKLEIPLNEELEINEEVNSFQLPKLEMRLPQAWTVKVETYVDLENMKDDLRLLKKRLKCSRKVSPDNLSFEIDLLKNNFAQVLNNCSFNIPRNLFITYWSN